MPSSRGVQVTGVTMPMLKDVLVKTVRQWKEGGRRTLSIRSTHAAFVS